MEPPAKRLRVQEESGPTDEPSPVVLLTDLSPLVTEADLLEALSPFGLINYAAVKRYRAVTGLVEFEEIESALACVKSSATSTVYITGTEATIAFSTLKSIPRHGFESPHPNHVLVLTVSNLTYNITANILKEICSAHGQVLRIAIVKRTSILVALVEFPSADIAKIVKHAINGADIYSGCCTLKVEFASVDRVRITILDSDHIDLTVPKGAPPSTRKTLIQGPPPDEVVERSYGGSQPSLPKSTPGLPPTNGYRREGIPADPYALDPYERRQPPSFDIDPRDELYARDSRDLYSCESHVDRYGGGRDPVARSSWGDEYPRDRTTYGYGAHDLYLPPRTARSSYEEFSASYQAALDHHSRAPRIAEPVQPKAEYFGDIDPTMMYGGAGCVVMVYGVDQMKLNCDKVFNIFCQYGNVLRILFMKQKENTAILEMGAPEQAKNLINYLNGVELFGLQLELKHSVQNAVRHVNNPFSLPDNTPSYRDYTQSRNQRFHNQMAGERNRLCHPQPVLHWFNAPPEMDGEKISEMFVQRGAAAPIATHVFNSRTGRSASGTVEFASALDATEAIALANHTPVSSDAGKHPFIVKLSFTQSRAPGTRPYEGGGDNTKIREASSARQGYRGGSERIQSPGGL